MYKAVGPRSLQRFCSAGATYILLGGPSPSVGHGKDRVMGSVKAQATVASNQF